MKNFKNCRIYWVNILNKIKYIINRSYKFKRKPSQRMLLVSNIMTHY